MKEHSKTLSSGERLFPRSEWVPDEELRGEAAVLRHPMIEEATRRAREQHKRRHDVIFVALCTSTRPYSSSPTWASFLRLKGADLVVTSNGGIVPLEFEMEWPFMSYDAPATGQATNDREYIEQMTARLSAFLDAHGYRGLVGAYMPHKRNREAAKRACKASGVSCALIPTPLQWAQFSRKQQAKNPRKKTEWYKATCGIAVYHPLAHPQIREWAQEAIDSYGNGGAAR